jgi:phospholipid/cholesterol/gamma-HCH transport system substrate-binding protein
MALNLKQGGLTRILSIVAVLAIVAALVIVALPKQDKKYLTASFPRTVSLYEGSDVRILGVPVGKVETVRPRGTDVAVRMWYDAKYDVPSDAQAVIISPAIVGDRFVQLTPVFRKGDKSMRSNAVLTTKSTSTPLELDEIYQSIDELTVALGPQGANANGALGKLLDSTAKNFAGQGAQFNTTLHNLGKFTATLDNNKEELFGTAREIERFVGALSKNDKTVRRFNDSLASASDLLADERQDLAAALRNLGVALQAVEGFVRENRQALSQNIKGLNRVSKVLVKQRGALDEILQVAPTALSNLFHTYNPATGTLDTRTNLGENLGALESDPIAFVCGLITAGGGKGAGDACKGLQGLGDVVPRNRSGAVAGGAVAPAVATEVENVDTTLAGIVEGDR